MRTASVRASFLVLVTLLAAVLAAPQIGSAAASPRWAPIVAPGPGRDSAGVHLNAVDCWSAGNCVAVGYRSYAGSYASVVDREADGRWSYDIGATTDTTDLTSVSCPASGACVAAGTHDPGTSHAQGVLEVQAGSDWTGIAATGAAGRYAAQTGTVTGVSCPVTGSCVAVGQAQNTTGVSTGFLLTLRPAKDRTAPSSWVATTAPERADEVTEDSGLTGVSCVRAGTCRAVGFAHADSDPGDVLPLVDDEKDYVWTYGASPTPSGAQDGRLRSVSCVRGGTACMAAGTYDDGQLPFVVTIDTADGTSQAAGVGLPTPFLSEDLSATSCAPDGQCQSVGTAYVPSGPDLGNNGFVVGERYGAGSPRAVSSATAGPKDANTVEHDETLVSTSCVSGGTCVSVGTYLDDTAQGCCPASYSQIAVIDTRTYSTSGAVRSTSDIRAPEPAVDNGSGEDPGALVSVHCTDKTHCVAVGSYQDPRSRAHPVIDTLGRTPPATSGSAPVVTRVRPAHGPTAGGRTVTVRGSHFTGATVVTFGAIDGSNMKVVSSTELTIRSPRHAKGRANVRVATARGTSAVSKADRFTYR